MGNFQSSWYLLWMNTYSERDENKFYYHEKDLNHNFTKELLCNKVIAKRNNHRRKKEELTQHIDEGSSVKKGFWIFWYFTFLFLNISILWNYITKNSKLRFAFSNSLNLLIFALRATKILLRPMFCFALYATILY